MKNWTVEVLFHQMKYRVLCHDPDENEFLLSAGGVPIEFNGSEKAWKYVMNNLPYRFVRVDLSY